MKHRQSKTIFVSGAYGVGKSTVCKAISQKLHIPHFSASDLIALKSGEVYGRNKLVSDLNKIKKSLFRLLHHCILNTKKFYFLDISAFLMQEMA